MSATLAHSRDQIAVLGQVNASVDEIDRRGELVDIPRLHGVYLHACRHLPQRD